MEENVLLVGLCVLARCSCWKCTFQTVEHHGPLCVSRCLVGVKKGMMTSQKREMMSRARQGKSRARLKACQVTN